MRRVLCVLWSPGAICGCSSQCFKPVQNSPRRGPLPGSTGEYHFIFDGHYKQPTGSQVQKEQKSNKNQSQNKWTTLHTVFTNLEAHKPEKLANLSKKTKSGGQKHSETLPVEFEVTMWQWRGAGVFGWVFYAEEAVFRPAHNHCYFLLADVAVVKNYFTISQEPTWHL